MTSGPARQKHEIEAISALNVSVKAQVINLMLELQNKLKPDYLFISHDMGQWSSGSAIAWHSCISARSWKSDPGGQLDVYKRQ